MSPSVPVITPAVVLRAIPYRDADLVLTLYTAEFGKVSALARSARRSRKRFGAAIQLFTLSDAELRRGRGDLWTLVSADTIQSFATLAGNMVGLAHASYGTELVLELTAAEQPDPDILALLTELYQVTLELGAAPAVLRAFELALLDRIGLAPVLDRCAGCGSDHQQARRGMLLDATRGGVVCASCGSRSTAAGVRPLSGPALDVLVAAQQAADLRSAHPGERAPADGAAEARDAMLALILGHVGKALRTVEFIAKLSAGLREARG